MKKALSFVFLLSISCTPLLAKECTCGPNCPPDCQCGCKEVEEVSCPCGPDCPADCKCGCKDQK